MKTQNIETIFDGRLDDQDLTWVILRGHVFVESMLLRSIERSVKVPNSVAALGLKYPGLVHLAIAVGAISEDYSSALFSLDSLRNRLGHQLVVNIEWEDAHGLVDALPRTWVEWLERRYDGDEKMVSYLRDVINILVLILRFGEETVAAAMDSPAIEHLRMQFKGEIPEHVEARHNARRKRPRRKKTT